jgi:FtsP/CotA-like multicopper oxidase with cupredoxin domain
VAQLWIISVDALNYDCAGHAVKALAGTLSVGVRVVPVQPRRRIGRNHDLIVQRRRAEIPSSHCGTTPEQKTERIFTANGEIRPQIPINAGERQFWRIVNASPDLYADLQLSGQQLEIVALDGMPLIMDFTDPIIRGMSLFHCHLLSHEDKGMMAKILFE